MLPRNRENVSPEDRVRFRELLAANRRLATAHALRDHLKHLWDYIYPGAARPFFDELYRWAIRSRIEPPKTFARHLKAKVLPDEQRLMT